MVRAQVRPPASAKRPRGSGSVGRLRRGSFALGMRRNRKRNSRVPCVWKRLAGRPSRGAGTRGRRPQSPHWHPVPPTSKRCGAPSFGPGIRHPLEPWIIRIGPGAQPDQPDLENLKAACASDSDARGTAHATTNERHLTVTQTSGCQRLITESPLRGRPHWSSDKLSSFMPSLATCTKSHSFRKI